ncbi:MULTISPECIES: hypothetical protein [Cupriavidus]
MTFKLILSALPAMLSILFIAFRVLGVAVNHTGFTPHYLDVLSLASVILAIAFRLDRTGLAIVVLLAIVNMALVIWAIESHNLLEYEDWIRRGMPGKTLGPGSR